MSEIPLYPASMLESILNGGTQEFFAAAQLGASRPGNYGGTSVIRNNPLLGPCSRSMSMVLRRSWGGGSTLRVSSWHLRGHLAHKKHPGTP